VGTEWQHDESKNESKSGRQLLQLKPKYGVGAKQNLTKEENGDFHSTLICNGTICLK